MQRKKVLARGNSTCQGHGSERAQCSHLGSHWEQAWSGEFWGWFLKIIYIFGVEGCWTYRWGQMAFGISPEEYIAPRLESRPIWHRCHHLHLEVSPDSPWLWSQCHPPWDDEWLHGCLQPGVLSYFARFFLTSFIERYKTRHLLATDHFCVLVTQKMVTFGKVKYYLLQVYNRDQPRWHLLNY